MLLLEFITHPVPNTAKFQEIVDDLNASVVESSDGDALSDTGALAWDPVVAVGLNGLTADLVGDFDEGPLTALVIEGVLHDSAL